MIYFTSDTHLLHNNIIRYCNRPFTSVDEMNETIIANWNNVVTPDDEVYHLGDVSFGHPNDTLRLLERLNGTIYLIRGNHDKKLQHNVMQRFEWVRDMYTVRVSDPQANRGVQEIVLCHYAMRVWDKAHHGAWHLYGHSHGSLPELDDSLSFDVGVDTHDFKPWSYEEVKAKMKTKTFKPIDHHKNERK